jgi:hypothetical protein
MAKSALDFPDPLDNTPKLSLDNADELISQLAGDDIDRLIHPSEHWQPQETPRDVVHIPATKKAASPEDLAAELDDVFERIRKQELTPPAPTIDTSEPEPITLPEPVLAMRRFDEPEATDIEPRRTLIQPLEEPPLPAVLRPLAWINAPVAQLSGKSRWAVNLVSVVSFVGSIAAFVYVLVLRRGM